MPSKQNLAATAAALGGLLAVGGTSYAFADGSTTPATSSAPSASSTASSGATATGHDHAAGARHEGRHGEAPRVSSTVVAAVKAAVSARYTGVTIQDVRQAPDGTYDAFGTNSEGTRVHYDVSRNYRTITLDTRAPEGQGSHEGEHRVPGKAVTGAAAVRVKAAIVARYPGFTINDVRQDADGSYRARGTKGATRAFFTVTSDLATVTEHTGRLHEGDHAGHRAA